MRVWPLVVVGILSLALGVWLTLRIHTWRQRRLGQARNARGKLGEDNAERVLIAHGYSIIARQQSATYAIDIGRQPHAVALMLDFVVERDGEQLVAEVKTGAAARMSHAGTRRQLLEYQLATQTRRVLLVDAEAETVTEVAYPLHANAGEPSAWPAWILVAALVALTLYAIAGR